MTRHHLRNEMDSISEEYCVDRADIGSALIGGGDSSQAMYRRAAGTLPRGAT